MHGVRVFALLICAGAVAASARAQNAPPEFTIQETASPAGLAPEQLKPKTIEFLDRPNEELIDPDAGLIRFEDWAQARPVEKQFLSPFPSFVEPMIETTVATIARIMLFGTAAAALEGVGGVNGCDISMLLITFYFQQRFILGGQRVVQLRGVASARLTSTKALRCRWGNVPAFALLEDGYCNKPTDY